ncbi:enoyl-CoA hydratase [Kordiimonas marina]|uniref:enoyl-CoA hydratase n=1 Tax=Kordiimonas marina TaxID=2872312 RepID=UPI001FF50698|nr:enoyl-CoA hydratase [Kordiimonas marina]MCJ9429518.1 enoyl-CoA hydratase [Kordiimonas marina]
MTDQVITEINNRVLTITFNRPDKKNALTHAMYAKAGDAIRDAAEDDGVRAILITGAGDAFTSGNDLADFRDTPPIGTDTPVRRFLDALVSAEKPIVAAVNGLAVGVGLTMLLHADIVYASETALLSAPFVDLALVPEAASSLLLPARVGHARAAEIFMLGKRVPADEALTMGLVSAVYPADALMPAAMKAAAMLAAKAPKALKLTKMLMRGDKDVVKTRMHEEGKYFGEQLVSSEVAEAITAFMQKRAPKFE